MANYNIAGDILCQGKNAVVRVDFDDPNGSNPQKIGAVQSYTATKTLDVQRAEVIGLLLPMSLDITGVHANFSLSGFIPAASFIEGMKSERGGGEYSMKSLNVDDESMIDKESVTKIPYLDLYDEREKCVIGSTCWVVPSSYSERSQGKGYITADVALEGIGYKNGSSYKSAIS